MKEKLVSLFFHFFGGKAKAYVSSAIVTFVLWLVAHVAAFSPSLAAAIGDPNAIAGWIGTILFALINTSTNSVHINNPMAKEILTDLSGSLDGIQNTEIPVKPATRVK